MILECFAGDCRVGCFKYSMMEKLLLFCFFALLKRREKEKAPTSDPVPYKPLNLGLERGSDVDGR